MQDSMVSFKKSFRANYWQLTKRHSLGHLGFITVRCVSLHGVQTASLSIVLFHEGLPDDFCNRFGFRLKDLCAVLKRRSCYVGGNKCGLGIFQDTNQISSFAERQRPWALIYLCFEREERFNFTTFLLQGHKMLLSKVSYADSLVLVI